MKQRFVLFLFHEELNQASQIRVNDRAAAAQLAITLNVLAIDTNDGTPLFTPVL
jgi:hypothetical protein